MIKKTNLRSNQGFTALDATAAIVIVSLMITLISTITYNAYTQLLSTHKNAMATSYAVEILEKVNKLRYDDSSIANGTYQTSEDNPTILGININSGYTAILGIQDYNKTAGNTTKRDLIKIVTAIIVYEDAGVEKNIMIKTLKLND